MNPMMKIRKFLAVLLLLCTVASVFVSCGGKKDDSIPTEKVSESEAAEVISAAKDLIPKTEVWNKLFYRKDGMPFLEGGLENGAYKEIDGEKLKLYGIIDTDDLREYAMTCFSSSMCDIFEQQLFEGNVDTWNSAVIDYWKIVYDEQSSSKIFVCMMGNPNELPIIEADECEFDYSTIEVLYKRENRVSISIQANGVGDNLGKSVTKTIDLIKEDQIWLIDNYTTVRFSK